MNPITAAALAYAKRGVPVFPCAASKEPMVRRGFHAATTDENQIRTWFDREPAPYIGIPTGEKSGIYVLDIDRKDGIDGSDALDALEREHGRLPDTVVALTPSGGEHRIFRWTERVRCSSGQLGLGLDVRGDGGYVIAPPSGDGNGHCYEFEASNPPRPATAPDWFLSLVRPPPERERAAYVEPTDPERIKALSALQAIQYMGHDRDEWVRIGMSYRAAGGDFESWDAWCASQPGYVAENVAKEWRSFNPDGGVGPGTLYHRAQQFGWDDGPDLYFGDPDESPLPLSVNAFKSLDFPPIEYLLGPIATQQLNLMFAPTGAGKTMFGLATGLALAEGRDHVGWTSTGGPKRVLYVDGEMAARMMQERFAAASSERMFVANLPGWWADQGRDPLNLTTEAAQAILTSWTERLEADVIILDNFMSLAWRDGVSFSSDEIWSPMRRWMIQQRAANRTVILVDHANAQGTVFGTKTKTHIMDLIMILEPSEADSEPDPDPDSLVIQAPWIGLKFTKNRGLSDSHEFVIHREVQIAPPGITWNWRRPVDPFLAEIAEMRESGISLRQIAKDLDVPFSKVQRAWKKVQASDSQ